MTKFYGKTQKGGPILGAFFWGKGISIEGTVTGKFETENGVCYNIKLNKAIKVGSRDGDSAKDQMTDVVAMGGMKGFENALMASGAETLMVKDKVKITCTGEQSTGKENPMLTFEVEVDRP